MATEKKLGRVGIFAKTIKTFLIDLERRFPSLFAETISEEMRERFLGQDEVPFVPTTINATLMEGIIYTGSCDKHIYALKDGAKLLKYPAGTFLNTTPREGPDGTIYVSGQGGNLYAFPGYDRYIEACWEKQRALKIQGKKQ